MPLNGIAEPIVVARLLAWLGSEENSHLCGRSKQARRDLTTRQRE
jgi:hypothetical protein